ncbi:hypothetical protein MTO96_008207 [Rhipicephalus appendiculatus]
MDSVMRSRAQGRAQAWGTWLVLCRNGALNHGLKGGDWSCLREPCVDGVVCAVKPRTRAMPVLSLLTEVKAWLTPGIGAKHVWAPVSHITWALLGRCWVTQAPARLAKVYRGSRLAQAWNHGVMTGMG